MGGWVGGRRGHLSEVCHWSVNDGQKQISTVIRNTPDRSANGKRVGGRGRHLQSVSFNQTDW